MPEHSDVETPETAPADEAATPVEEASVAAERGDRDDASSAGEASEPDAESAPAPVADEVLLAAVELARHALEEITPAATIGEPVGHIVEGPDALSLLFATTLPGYPGWHWTVSLARVGDEEPTVLEAELMPGGEALLAPDWVPWAERLADYRAAQAAAAAAEIVDEDDDEDDSDDELDYDYDDDVDIDVFGEDDSIEGDPAEDDAEFDDGSAGPAGEDDDESDEAETDADEAGGESPIESATLEAVTPDQDEDERDQP